MTDTKYCPNCNSEIPADAPYVQCPDCLLQLGVPDEQMIDATIDSHAPGSGGPHQAPRPEELKSSFPQLDIEEVIGLGGMGAVYKATQRGLGRDVALKIIKADKANVPGFEERFIREAKALAHLNHPNIVAVYDFGETDGMFYFIMEYVDGPNLRALMEVAELEPEQALSVVMQVCEALQFAHDEGVVHRDIKPENILVDQRGRVKIADFGLAKLLNDSDNDHNLTGTYQVMGTPKYMAPEQMEGSQHVDHRADIYSVGVVFYELLTGEIPLGRFVAPSQRAAVDNRLDEVVMRALERDLPKRFQQANDLRSEVESISRTNMHPAEVPHCPPTLPSGSRPQMEKHVTILGIASVALNAILVVAAIAIFLLLSTIGIASQDPDAMRVLPTIGGGLGVVLLVLGLPGLIAGVGLLKRKPWSRIFTMVLAFLNLVNIPFGTIFSIYAFWVLLHEDTIALFAERRTRADL